MKKLSTLAVVLILATGSYANCWDPCECAGQPYGDATCDGMVNLADLFALRSTFGRSRPFSDPVCCADFNHDGYVSLGDLFALKAYFGTGPYSPSTGDQFCTWSPDIDKNLHVDELDYAYLAGGWGDCNHVNRLPGDLTGDGCVNGKDLKLIGESWLTCYVGGGGLCAAVGEQHRCGPQCCA